MAVDRRRDRILTEPEEIKAVAHPARVAVLEHLLGGEELTATQCAELVGLSPSAMSYHLRALEKHGFVERVESADGRERPWRLVFDSWRIVTTRPGQEASGAEDDVRIAILDRWAASARAWARHEYDAPEQWRKAATVSNSLAWLTTDEIAQITAAYEQVIEQARGRTAAKHPRGARRVRIGHLVAPDPAVES